ncbi:hypothetical protein V8F33_004701 [Rhypophila sp. PSN 637]
MDSVPSNTGGDNIAPGRPVPGPNTTAGNIVSAYLSKHIPEYKELVQLRREGWNNASADVHFQNERSSADNPTDQQKDRFYRMTCRIGNDLASFLGSGGLSLPSPPRRTIFVLDLCMAPGGFSTTVLSQNPNHDVSIYGVTLPVSMGGYEVRIPNWESDPRIEDIRFLDVTMLASEVGITPDKIPALHPDKNSFITTPLFSDQQKFDIIFCGGTVVRNHTQSPSYQSYRQGSEGTRLLTSQLVIAMSRIRPGGTMVIVLHRADAWMNVALFYRFSKFSDVSKMRLFKPARAHARKGSFYLVVCGVDPEKMEAQQSVDEWRRRWMFASMLSMDTHQDLVGGDEDDADEQLSWNAEAVLEDFGPQLIQLTRPVFKIQAEALRTAPWAGSSTRGG